MLGLAPGADLEMRPHSGCIILRKSAHEVGPQKHPHVAAATRLRCHAADHHDPAAGSVRARCCFPRKDHLRKQVAYPSLYQITREREWEAVIVKANGRYRAGTPGQ